VSQAQFAVLTVIAAHPGLPAADLTSLSRFDPRTVRVAVDCLERAGLVVARADGRCERLDVTEAGERALARARQPIVALEADLAAGLSAADERAIRRWLVQVEAAKRLR
jgi:DNA-binding MarR family transcriptional regulator